MIKIIKKGDSLKESPKPKQALDVTQLRKTWLSELKETKEKRREQDIAKFGGFRL